MRSFGTCLMSFFVLFLLWVSTGAFQEGIDVHAETRAPPAIIFIAYFESPDNSRTTSRSNMRFFLDYSFKAGNVGVEYDIVVVEAQSANGGSLYWRYWSKQSKHFRWLMVKNEGYDFCLWKKAINALNLSDYKFLSIQM